MQSHPLSSLSCFEYKWDYGAIVATLWHGRKDDKKMTEVSANISLKTSHFVEKIYLNLFMQYQLGICFLAPHPHTGTLERTKD